MPGTRVGEDLTSESVEGTSLSLESVHNVHSGDSLPLGVLTVGHGIPDHVLQENLEDTSGLFVDQTTDTLDSTPSSESSNGRLGDSLDVVTENLSVTLGTSLSESLASFTTARHVFRS